MFAAAIAITILAPLLWLGLNYLEFKREYDEISKQWSKVVERLKERRKLSATIAGILNKGAIGQSDLLSQLVSLSQVAASSNDVSLIETVKKETEFGAVLGQALQAAENNSTILDNEEYIQARTALLECEDEILSLRDDYNKLVYNINYRRSIFPTKLIVEKLHMEPVADLKLTDTFEQYPLKFKPTQPIKKESILFADLESKSSKKRDK